MVAALGAVLSIAPSARAETWSVSPLLTMGAAYDDNLFFNDARLAAAGFRGGPALTAEYQVSPRLTLQSRAGVESEYFGEAAASSWAARRNAGLAARYRLGAHTTASLSGDYALSAYAAELVPTAGVEYGRRRAESLGSQVELEHRVSPKIILRLGYGMQSLRLEGSGPGPRMQLSSDADVAFQVAPHTMLKLQVGPRYLEGSLGAHVAATLERTRPRTRLSVGYERGRTLVFDRPLVIETYAAKLSYRVSAAVAVTASPALYRQWLFAAEQRSWHLAGAAVYRAKPWLTAFVNHVYVLQDRGFFIDPSTDRPGPPQLSRNSLTAGFIVGPHLVREAATP
jgi:hypothetical protein